MIITFTPHFLKTYVIDGKPYLSLIIMEIGTNFDKNYDWKTKNKRVKRQSTIYRDTYSVNRQEQN